MSASLEVKINPAVLVWARKTANYEVEEISHKMDLNSDRMKKWEKGKENPTYVQLLDLAKYYQRPAMLFFSPEIPDSEPDTVPDFRTLPNKNTKKISSEVTFELRSARARRKNLISLEEFDEYDFPLFNLNARMSENIQSLAENIKKTLDLSWGKQDTLKNHEKALEFYISRIENIGVLVFQFYGITPEEMRGYAINYKKLPIIGINVKEHPHGKIFTLFHELTHLALKKEGISNVTNYRLKNKVEIFCNQVAAEILVPEKILLKNNIVNEITNGSVDDKSLIRLSKRFKVSKEVIIRRLLSINKLSPEFFKTKQKEWNTYIASDYKTKKNSSKIENTQKPKKGGNNEETKKDPNISKALKRNGFYYTEMVFEAYDNDLITSSDLAEYLSEKLQTIYEIQNIISKRGILK
jgi:Zn-dependent peptidase ImmA (M78 family)/transcriptional regulator with XRE-family HTH domain